MKYLFTFLLLSFISFQVDSKEGWKGNWISTMTNQNQTNSWLGYRKSIVIAELPQLITAKIAVDSKYWLWINGEPVVLEGGLKRGPTPNDTYYDEVDLSKYFKKGKNVIAILVWFFGKDGFSHNSSGKAGLLFNCQIGNLSVNSDKNWKCKLMPEFQTAALPIPNFRLSESNILYDARLSQGNWQQLDYDDSTMTPALEIGAPGDSPWNRLVKRAIPQWKDYGLKDYPNLKFPFVSKGDTIVCDLPYNAQITPYLEIDAKEGERIRICTDNYLIYNGSSETIRAEYITKQGPQRYENLGWMNGHKVFYFIPKGVKVLSLKYRESGFDCSLSGSFKSSDVFFNDLWKKAQRTLYVTMRDTYMDCPERERAQWTGDAVNQSAQAFYALSTSSAELSKKWLHELMGWQRKDGSIYAPVPSSNWKSELPCQVLASIGYYGLWNYYLHSGDKQTLSELYPKAKRYLDLWEKDSSGTMKVRKGDWTWGDWGYDRDINLIYNLWYYIAVQGMYHSALELKLPNDAAKYKKFMKEFELSFNKQYWNGAAYRSLDYKDKTDDRAQALAVVSGIAAKSKYSSILKVFKTEEHASPYMEKYVFEAMFKMRMENEALDRHRKRFSSMVNDRRFTTLFEGWGIGKEGFGGGTVNHSWSGGGLIVLSQNLCGIAPVAPGYKVFQVIPQPGYIKWAAAKIETVSGEIEASFNQDLVGIAINTSIPKTTKGIIGIEAKHKNITVNDIVIIRDGKFVKNKLVEGIVEENSYVKFSLNPGSWKIVAH